MSSLNQVQLIGNLTQEPDVKNTASDKTIVNVSIATNSRYKEGDEWKEKVEYHNVVAFAYTANSLAKYAKKGMQVFVQGRLETQSWDDKATGAKRYKTVIIADTVILPRKEGQGDKFDEKPTKKVVKPLTTEDIPF